MARTGRPPVAGESRSKPLSVRFSASERKAISAARGSRTEADFVREATREKIERERL